MFQNLSCYRGAPLCFYEYYFKIVKDSDLTLFFFLLHYYSVVRFGNAELGEVMPPLTLITLFNS